MEYCLPLKRTRIKLIIYSLLLIWITSSLLAFCEFEEIATAGNPHEIHHHTSKIPESMDGCCDEASRHAVCDLQANNEIIKPNETYSSKLIGTNTDYRFVNIKINLNPTPNQIPSPHKYKPRNSLLAQKTSFLT
ncbi:MAG: hypothetical protein OEY59_07495 [Deltaproteobacteria bacterium]|nr:hypothetical protein [Deltaproteobacteria bacterium]